MLVVLVVTGIITVSGFYTYSTIKERAFNREAYASLLLIQVAERNYKMENNCYYPCGLATPVTPTPADITTINNNLRLSLPTTTPQWTIRLDCTGSGLATASRLGRTWTINFPPGSAEKPICSGSGCPS